MSKKIGKYTYTLSPRIDKKLMTVVDGKKIHFGNPSYDHFFDKSSLLPKHMNHKDKERRSYYLKRAKGIRDKEGNLTCNNPLSPNYHAIRILW